MENIRIGIVGYGNLGKAVHGAVKNSGDMTLAALFTKREPKSLGINDVNVYAYDTISDYAGKLDALVLCDGSATVLPVQTPYLASMYNLVDSFDTHANIPEHFNKVNAAATANKKTAVISAGWDPGIFSLFRLLGEAFLPSGNTYSFWGEGVSQGHSNAIRRIDGVLNAVQYSLPIESAVNAVRNNENPSLSARQKHKRLCYVAVEPNADKAKIEAEIKNMPNYFAEYDTTVEFVSEAELLQNHSKLPHGGYVFRSGITGAENNSIMELKLKMDSNPEFTAGILLAYARAAVRMESLGNYGAKTVIDIPPVYLSPRDSAELYRELI